MLQLYVSAFSAILPLYDAARVQSGSFRRVHVHRRRLTRALAADGSFPPLFRRRAGVASDAGSAGCRTLQSGTHCTQTASYEGEPLGGKSTHIYTFYSKITVA